MWMLGLEPSQKLDCLLWHTHFPFMHFHKIDWLAVFAVDPDPFPDFTVVYPIHVTCDFCPAGNHASVIFWAEYRNLECLTNGERPKIPADYGMTGERYCP